MTNISSTSNNPLPPQPLIQKNQFSTEFSTESDNISNQDPVEDLALMPYQANQSITTFNNSQSQTEFLATMAWVQIGAKFTS